MLSMAQAIFHYVKLNLSYFLVQFSFMGHQLTKSTHLQTYLQHRIREMKSGISNFVTIWLSMKEKVGFHLSANEGEKEGFSNLKRM